MTIHSTNEFQNDYLKTWTEPDPAIRRRAMDRMWREDGCLAISALGITLQGIDAIAAHITRVHDDNIAGRGMRFTYDHQVEAADALLLRWSMWLPNGAVAGRGVDVVFRDQDGRVRRVYMFMGVS